MSLDELEPLLPASASARLVGIMHPDTDVDDFPTRDQMPDGFIGMLGSCTSGQHDFWPMVEGRLLLEGDKIDFLMSIDQARDLLALLQSAIAAAEASETGWRDAEVQLSEADA